MKKIFTLLCLAVSAGSFAQSFALYRTNITTNAITQTITNGGGYVEATAAGDPQHPSALLEDRILIKNTSAVTHTYSVTRTIVSQNPTLILDGSTNTPNTYFCFGNTCFGSNVSTADPTNYTPLAAEGQTTSGGIDDNSNDNGQPFVIYFSEGNVQGSYVVQYKVFNISDPNDTLAFKVGYNQASVGIKNQGSIASDLISEIYPNPASGSKIYFNLGKDDELKFQVYNSLGGLVYTSNKQKFTAGKNLLPVDGADLSSGMYFITISNNTASATKRLIISK
jgi:hypothetical protein